MSRELEHIESQLKRIERETQSLRDKLSNLSDHKHKLLPRYYELKFGVKVGMIVMVRGVEHRVTRVDPKWGTDRPWLEGNPKRKDGTFGTAHRNLYDYWELVKETT